MVPAFSGGPGSASEPRSVYIHVPFCARKCEYCAFYSTSADGELIRRYVGALVREIRERSGSWGRPLETVFFGGGTPSLLTLSQWELLLGVWEGLGLSGVGEWTVECNPATLSEDKARLLRAGGVNRISLGVQSLDEGLLDRLGRVHSRDMVFRSYDVLRRAGFENINLDLMFAIPGQTMASWEATVREALAMGSEHLSCYEVIYEDDTPLFAQLRAGEFEVDEELAERMYERWVEAADGAGYRQYEVANFARDGAGGELPERACRHNVNYWRGGRYAGLGPSASGYEGEVRYRQVSSTQAYCQAIDTGASAREWVDGLSGLARAGEVAAFGLRMNAGWPWEAFRRATGYDLREGWSAAMATLKGRGWGVEEADRFRLTAQGMRFADAAGSEFVGG
ncbi:MAG: radical SAM family heme chaperone HemW [Verrucomicrobiae bacterium]|nr:radical SAM family heme chaperone HemW [Verrucomicrobiae bacterium]